MPFPSFNWPRIRRILVVVTYRGLRRGKRRIPPGLRLVVGFLLVFLGILGFLPILGFWMIPLGIAVASLDIPPLYRVLNRKLRTLRHRRRLVCEHDTGCGQSKHDSDTR